MGLKETYGTFLKTRANLGHAPSGQPIEKSNLNDAEMMIAMRQLGEYLGTDLHSRRANGFGWAEHLPIVLYREIKAPYLNWPDFLLAFFDLQTKQMEQVRENESIIGVGTQLAPKTRYVMDRLWEVRPKARELFEANRSMLNATDSNLLHGNLHLGSIYVHGGTFSGTADYSQMLLGDPIDDLAYLSVMPEGEKWLPFVRRGWDGATQNSNFNRGSTEERLHLYRLWESYRKIGTRYIKHHNLEEFSEPLTIARQELSNFGAI